MRKIFFFIMFVIWVNFLPGCRSQRQMDVTETQHNTSEIGVEFHELERLWNSVAERLNLKIEFYPATGGPWTATTDAGTPFDPYAVLVPPAPSEGAAAGGIGPIKSIEFSSECIATDSSLSQTDSTADFKSDSDSKAHTEKASELRQDNSTWAIVAVVAAVAFIVIVLIVINKFFKK